MAGARVYVTRRIPKVGLERIQSIAQAQVWEEELPPPYEVLLDKVRGRDGLVTLLTDKVDAKLMEAAGSSLRVISQYAVGYDNIDVGEATQRGIQVGHTPGALTDATADFTWALLMAAARRLVEGDRYVRAGRWRTWGPELFLGREIAGTTLGIVGLGRIGKAVARRARGFEMRVLYYEPEPLKEAESELGVVYAPLEELLAEADFVSLHAPLTDETHHMIGTKAFVCMRPTAVLINCARGPMVDPRALHLALKHGQIAYAALDVTDPEPLPSDSPLLDLENLILTPHMASASQKARERMATMAAENLAAGLKDEPLPYSVNPEAARV
jgi:glyoxylate reductase